MTERDPIDLLANLIDQPQMPSDDFARRLRSELLTQLGDDRQVVTSIEGNLMLKPNDTPPRRWPRFAAAAAVVLALVGGLLLFARDSDELPADLPEAPTDAPSPTLSVETAQAMLEAVGGLEGLTLSTYTERERIQRITFDPLDPNRALAANLDIDRPQATDVWSLDDGSVVPLSYSVENGNAGAVLQRDGTIWIDPGQAGTIFPVLRNDGEFLATLRTGDFPIYTSVSEGTSMVSLLTNTSTCPYRALTISNVAADRNPGSSTVLADRIELEVGVYNRVDIPEPGVAVAFPYFPDSPTILCVPPAGATALVYDIATQQPIVDHPFHDAEIARGAISGNRARAMILRPDSSVAVISMETQEVLMELGTFDAGTSIEPLVLDEAGQIAVVTEDDGRATVIHVDSGTVLLEVTGDQRFTFFRANLSTPVAYDASRIAALSADVWTAYTLDPNEWLERACAAGFEISVDERRQQGLDIDVDCG